jgi:hypothetical protein
LEISFPKPAHKFYGSRIARVWITPGGSCSNGLSVDLGVDSSMDQIKIVLCQRNIRLPSRPQQQLRLSRRTQKTCEHQNDASNSARHGCTPGGHISAFKRRMIGSALMDVN